MGALWPAYRVRSPPRRTYALWQRPDALVDENGEVLRCPTLDDVTTALFAGDRIGLIPSLRTWPLLADAIASPSAAVLTAGRRGIHAIRFQEGRRVRWLVGLSSFSVPPEPSSLRSVRGLMDLLGVGDFPTPGGAGAALMRQLYPRDVPRLVQPPRRAWELLHRTVVGGRVDLEQPGQTYARLWKLDMNSAYWAGLTQVPAGTACRFRGPLPAGEATGYQEVDFIIPPGGLVLGIIPVRERGGRVAYPREPGIYRGFAWEEEIREAEAMGVRVYRRDGYCWPLLTPDLGLWSTAMWRIRQQAGELEGLVKLAGVAAIGQLGSDRVGYELVPLGEGVEPFIDPETGATVPYDLRARARPGPHMKHIASYVHMRTRLALYRRALPEQTARALVATDYDAVYTTREPADAASGELGGWKRSLLTNARADARRFLVSDQEVKMPGVSRVS